MHGLPQAGILANQLLKRKIAKYGYYKAYGNTTHDQYSSCLLWMILESNMLTTNYAEQLY
ncbi:hypothetical protein ACHAXS_009492 [Conticribra weissflogii]